MPPPSENIPFPGMPEVKVPIGKGAASGVPNVIIYLIYLDIFISNSEVNLHLK